MVVNEEGEAWKLNMAGKKLKQEWQTWLRKKGGKAGKTNMVYRGGGRRRDNKHDWKGRRSREDKHD